MLKKISALVLLFIGVLPGLLAQQINNSETEKKYTAFDMRNNGKIYVVVAVILIILIGLLIYLFILDRKITLLEKESS
jgi:uncharacterized membrane protein